MKFVSRSFALLAAVAIVSACSGGGGSPTPRGVVPTATPSVAPSPTTSPSTSPTGTAAAFTCPSSDTVAARVTSSRASGLGDALGRRLNRGRAASLSTPGRLEVTYDLATLTSSRTALAAREGSLSTSLIRESDYPRLGIATRILRVAPSQASAVAAKLATLSGVRNVTVASMRLLKQTVTTPYFPNDPYFTGFKVTEPPTATSTAPPATYEVGPYEETADVPGQWNEHAIGLEKAFAYSQSNNGSGVTNAGALGSSSIKLAIIDTGEDTTHPELASKVAYQKCFITNPTSNVQSTSNFTTDEDGHGTDVSGLATAATNNNLGFASPGGNTSLYAYRVQATPDDNCANESTNDQQCSTDTADIASAVDDAVAHGVSVISISLGGGECTTSGVDPDPTEGNAIENAISAGVIVVAAAGNDGSQGLEAPACDAGVIAAGATSLADGQPNGLNSAGSAASPTEYVASYSDYGTPGAAAKSASAWGIVSPGGDPSSDTDADDLHWIEDIWTSTPYMSSPSDTNFEGECVVDYPGTGSTTDCRTLIAGTSMSAPTVAGAAALIVAANSGYASSTKMKTLLCTTADDIGDPKEGCGRLNVYRAMAVAVGDSSPP